MSDARSLANSTISNEPINDDQLNLAKLPYDIIAIIALLLSLKDINRLARTSSIMKESLYQSFTMFKSSYNNKLLKYEDVLDIGLGHQEIESLLKEYRRSPGCLSDFFTRSHHPQSPMAVLLAGISAAFGAIGGSVIANSYHAEIQPLYEAVSFGGTTNVALYAAAYLFSNINNINFDFKKITNLPSFAESLYLMSGFFPSGCAYLCGADKITSGLATVATTLLNLNKQWTNNNFIDLTNLHYEAGILSSLYLSFPFALTASFVYGLINGDILTNSLRGTFYGMTVGSGIAVCASMADFVVEYCGNRFFTQHRETRKEAIKNLVDEKNKIESTFRIMR